MSNENTSSPQTKDQAVAEAMALAEKCVHGLMRAAVEAYRREIESRRLVDQVIGPGKQYATSQEWIDARVAAWTEDKPMEVRLEFGVGARVETRDSAGQKRSGVITGESEDKRQWLVFVAGTGGPQPFEKKDVVAA